MRRRGRILTGIVALLLALPLAACGGDGDGELTDVTIGLSFVPNIQFAPYYIADAKGFYEEAGVNVSLNHHGVGADLFAALVAGQETMMMAGGDEVLQARGNDVPLVYVAEIYTQYPVGLIVPADSDIMSIAGLRGHTVGIPGAYGANYIGLLALLDSAGLTEADITVESVGFTQASALLAGHVDAVMGYVNNEPIQISKAGMEVRVFPVSDVQPLVSNGLVALEETLSDDRDTIEAIVAATLRGAQYAIDNPDEAVEIARDYVPTLTTEENLADARAVLDATLPMWEPTGAPGESEPASWESMLAFFEEYGFVTAEIDLSEVYSNDYLPD
ncbi:MAG TPA: ABC transporter substrate-binding protein [Thermomicrobiales bacterium]|nr:ABC transporter substrate-binding protein [Thermomicrobiales bacterium]